MSCMHHTKSSMRSILSAGLHLKGGKLMVLSPQSELLEVSAYITTEKLKLSLKDRMHLQVLKQRMYRQRWRCMPESPVNIKKEISNDKSNDLQVNILTASCSQTSVQESTSNVKGSKPFWTKSSLALSKLLWSPIKTDCVDLAMNCSNLLHTDLVSRSKFSIALSTSRTHNQKQSKISSLFSTSTRPEPMVSDQLNTDEKKQQEDSEDTSKKTKQKKAKTVKTPKIDASTDTLNKIDTIEVIKKGKKREDTSKMGGWRKKVPKDLKIMKVRIYPTDKQKLYLQAHVELLNMLYDRFLSEYHSIPDGEYVKDDFINDMRERYVSVDFVGYPVLAYDVKNLVLTNFTNLVKTHGKNLTASRQQNNITSFTVESKHIKLDIESGGFIFNPQITQQNIKSGFTDKNFISLNLRDINLKTLPLTGNWTIVKEYHKYWVCINVPLDYSPRPEKVRPVSDQKSKVIAIDPGVRTFLTCYDGDKSMTIGQMSDLEKVKKLFIKTSGIRSYLDSGHSLGPKKVEKLQIKLHHYYAKISNILKNFHHHVANFLLHNYEHILLPKFATSEMKKTENRSIGKETVKDMSIWSHYKFQSILNYKQKLYNCKVHIVEEHFTTKTCSSCGKLKDVGKSKTYDCDHCGSVFDRDINASKNILLKNIKCVK